MIDEAKQEARYEIHGRVFYLRPLLAGQAQQFEQHPELLKIEAQAGGSPNDVLLFGITKPEHMAALCSCAGTDEQGEPITVTVAETRRFTVDQCVEIWNDFFSLNPKWARLFTTLLVVTLNSAAAATTFSGPAANIGSTLSAAPAGETSPGRPL